MVIAVREATPSNEIMEITCERDARGKLSTEKNGF